jgi:transposase-like protein
MGVVVPSDRQQRQNVDFRLSRKRDATAAKVFFRKTIKNQVSATRTITSDGYAASHRAVRERKNRATFEDRA